MSKFGDFIKQLGNAMQGKPTGDGSGSGLAGLIAGLINPVLGVGVNILGGILGNKTVNKHLTGKEKEQNEFNAQQAQLQRDFEADMSNTAYQRGVADMQAAGVNPALAMSNGGASTPTGSNASGSASVINPMTAMVEAMKAFGEMKLMKDQGQAAKTNAQAAVTSAEASKTQAEAAQTNAETNKRNAAVNERNASVNEQRVAIESAATAQHIQLEQKEIDKLAVDMAHVNKIILQMDDYLAIAKKNANTAAQQAIAALRQADAAIQNAVTASERADYENGLTYSQTLLNEIITGQNKEILRWLPKELQYKVENLAKQGLVLDQQGRLMHRQGNLATAQTVHEYTKTACEVVDEVLKFIPMTGGSGIGFTP